MTDFPRSLIEFQQRFGDEAACAQYLAAARWPDGFVCPGCGGGKAWRLQTKAWTYECTHCARQTSVTAGTIMHHSKLPLTAWFWAAYLMATHSNGISALQLQRQLAFGSYKTDAGCRLAPSDHRTGAHASLGSFDRHIRLRRERASQFARDLYGAFPVKRLFWVVLTVF